MRNEDARSKRIVLVSSCVLNGNNKVQELSCYPGACKPIIELLMEYDIGIMQMDCPETLYLGITRWSATKNLYDTPGYRRHCRKLAQKQADYIQCYYDAGYEVVAIFWINGSPSCGCGITCFDERWGGTPMDMGDDSTFVEGDGVFVEEFMKELEERQMQKPYNYGLDLEDMSVSIETICSKLKDFLEKRKEDAVWKHQS